MTAMIGVTETTPLPDATFTVTVTDDDGTGTTHCVHLDQSYLTALGYEATAAEVLLQDAFHFLLAREAKEAIQPEFHVRDIEHYFGDFADAVQRSDD